MLGRILISLLLNYLVLGGIILLMARWLIDDSELWAGFAIIAAVPPAVASNTKIAAEWVSNNTGAMGCKNAFGHDREKYLAEEKKWVWYN